jgi:hypothetical protein
MTGAIVKKGLILIIFAWGVECIAVVAGFVTAIVTTFPEGELPESKWKWLWVLPMGMIGVAELGRIPLTSVLFYRHKVMQTIALIGIIFLAGLAFENWMFGFERIVQLRLGPVNEAKSDFDDKNDRLATLTGERDNAAANDKEKLDNLQRQLDKISLLITKEDQNHSTIMEQISERCVKIRERCMVPQQNEENHRYGEAKRSLEEQKTSLTKQIDQAISTNHTNTESFKTGVAEATKETERAREELKQTQGRQSNLSARCYVVSPRSGKGYARAIRGRAALVLYL